MAGIYTVDKVKKIFIGNIKAKNVWLGNYKVWVSTIQIIIPTVASNPTYNGSAQSPTWNNYDSSKMNIGGTYSATNAGTYTSTFTPKEGYSWDISGDDTSTKSIEWSINRAIGSVTTAPTAKSLTYTGSAQTLANAGSGTGTMYYSLSSSSGFSTSIPTATNAGKYTVYYYAAASGNYNQSSTSNISCNISTVPATITTNYSSISMPVGTKTLTLTVSRTGSGTITVTSSDTSIITVSGTTSVTITKVNAGNCNIIVSVDASGNYGAASKTISCSCVNSTSLTYSTFSDYLGLNSSYGRSDYTPVMLTSGNMYVQAAYRLYSCYVWFRSTNKIDISNYSSISVSVTITRATGESGSYYSYAYLVGNASASACSKSSMSSPYYTLYSTTSYSETKIASFSLSSIKSLQGNSVYLYFGVKYSGSWWAMAKFNSIALIE